jgi:cystathionine beta-lyase/cystathionine gamma-synthase
MANTTTFSPATFKRKYSRMDTGTQQAILAGRHLRDVIARLEKHDGLARTIENAVKNGLTFAELLHIYKVYEAIQYDAIHAKPA